MKRITAIFFLFFGVAWTALAQIYPLKVCSFNIQFLGQSKIRKNAELAELLRGQDVVVVQELVAPPYAGVFPDGKPFKPDPEARLFFDHMRKAGFDYWLSDEDTGPGAKNQRNTSATEWFVAFYKTNQVRRALDLPGGFLAADRTANTDYDRVPYAFGFRTPDGRLDFVLISVHLRPGAGSKNKLRRHQELTAINAWTAAQHHTERDYVVLGDMNIESPVELLDAMPPEFQSLNRQCLPTNTSGTSPKPYDHVMYQPAFTQGEIDQTFGFQVVNLIAAMKPAWKPKNKKYPGSPHYNHNQFRQYFSDHHPVQFRLQPRPGGDDD